MTIGFALCGSFCTYAQVFPVMEQLAKEYRLVPIFSAASAGTDSRFGKSADFMQQAEAICQCPPLTDIPQVEPIGPKSSWTCSSLPPAPATPWPSWPTALPTAP